MSKKKKNIMAREMDGFRKNKKPSKKQQEKLDHIEARKKKMRDFFKAYTLVCEEHGLQVESELRRDKRGIVPKANIGVYYGEKRKTKSRAVFMVVNFFKRMMITGWRRKKYIKDYEIACKAHRVQLDVIVEITAKGIMPKMNITDYVPKAPKVEVKDWDKAKEENKEWAKQAEADRGAMSEEEFKKKWPDRPYKLEKKNEKE